MHYQVTGAAPSRVLTVEFKNMRWLRVSPIPNANFRIKLYEGTNVIEFIYGVFEAPVSGSASI